MSKAAEKYLHRLRNIGIIAHIDAGKTTLTERILYYTKRIHRMGEVHEGTATMDYMPEEQERGITITSAFTSCQWQDKQINIIDTPGHVDFTIEVERSLRVLDGAIGVFCAVGGVEPQSETVWHQSERYRVPKLAFVNKMDRLGADFEAVLEAMRERLGARPLALQLPEGQGREFQGIIDLMRWEFLEFDIESKGETFAHKPLTAEQEERARAWWEALVEAAAEEDEAVFEAYVEGQPVDTEAVKRALRSLTLSQKAVPVYLGSALKYIGVQPVLDGIRDYLPSPLDVPPAQGLDPETQHPKSFPVAAESPLSALVFKVTMETGRKLVLARLYSGAIEPGETLYNATQHIEERAARLFTLHAGHKDKLSQARAGEIVALAGMRQTRTGDTLCRRSDPLVLEQISAYRPVLSLALEARTTKDEEKLLEALDKLLQEDPTLFLQREEDTEQIILSGMGELHLEVVLERLRREYHVELRAGKPQVVYQETIGQPAAATGVFDRELGEKPHFGQVEVRVEPRRTRQSENDIVFTLNSDGLPEKWLDAAAKGVEDALQSGVVLGYPVHGVRVQVTGMQHGPNGSEAGYHMAAVSAVKQALEAANAKLMEPIMWVEVFVPEDFVGDVVALFGSKGGKIENMFDRGGQKVVQAFSPLRSLFGFSTELRSSTQGRATFVMRFDRFDVLEKN